jgi:hypothetical protein
VNALAHEYAEWDAAYVLGALSPVERREYEEHLAGCPACQAAISELAGLPGLLAQVAPEDAEVLAVVPGGSVIDSPPASLLPKVIIKARNRRRRRIGAIVAAAAAVIVILVGIGVGTGLLPLGPQSPRRLAFVPVVPSSITAVVDVVPIKGGTGIAVECQYGEVSEPRPGGAYAEYSIFVVDRSGRAELVKKWPAKPNKVMRPSGNTDLRVNQIAQVEIRDSTTDQTLLRAPLR